MAKNKTNNQFDREKERLDKLFLNRRHRKDEPEPGDGELNVNHAKYMVAREKKGKYKLARIGMIMLYVLYFALPLLLGLINVYFLIGGMTLFLILFKVVHFQTWRFVNQDYGVVVNENDFIAAVVYGNTKLKKLAMTKVSTAQIICPCEEKYLTKFAPEQIKNKIDITAGSTIDKYFIIYKNENGEDCVIFFEAAQKLLRAIKHYNSAATVVVKTSK